MPPRKRKAPAASDGQGSGARGKVAKLASAESDITESDAEPTPTAQLVRSASEIKLHAFLRKTSLLFIEGDGSAESGVALSESANPEAAVEAKGQWACVLVRNLPSRASEKPSPPKFPGKWHMNLYNRALKDWKASLENCGPGFTEKYTGAGSANLFRVRVSNALTDLRSSLFSVSWEWIDPLSVIIIDYLGSEWAGHLQSVFTVEVDLPRLQHLVHTGELERLLDVQTLKPSLHDDIFRAVGRASLATFPSTSAGYERYHQVVAPRLGVSVRSLARLFCVSSSSSCASVSVRVIPS